MVTGNLSNINLAAVLLTVFIILLIFKLPRRYAALPFLIIGSYMTLGQRIDLLGLNFYMLRIVIFFGWIYIFLHRKEYSIQLNSLDKIILYWIASHALVFVLREQTAEALKYQLGFAYNAAGIYFIFRYLIQSFDYVEGILKWFSIIIIPVGALFLIEFTTGENIFSIFGGVPAVTAIRDGRLRCQGPFAHPILAGTFGAISLPLFLSMLWNRNSIFISVTAVIAAFVIIVTSGSSGPYISFLFSVLALFMWKFKKNMPVVRYGILIALILLHAVMNAPVWFLFARLGDFFGGTGWHRAELINQAIKNIDIWWLFGTNLSNTADWMPYSIIIGTQQADITNQFISEGITGGLLTLLLFICIIVVCYKYIGKSLKACEHNRSIQKYLWCFGVSLFAHCVSLTSVPYFDQIIIYWYFLIAMISTCWHFTINPKTAVTTV